VPTEYILPLTSAPALQVARVADFGANDTVLSTVTHLGHVLRPGDRAMGYDLEHANVTDDALEAWLQRPGAALPDVVLVREGMQIICWGCKSFAVTNRHQIALLFSKYHVVEQRQCPSDDSQLGPTGAL